MRWERRRSRAGRHRGRDDRRRADAGIREPRSARTHALDALDVAVEPLARRALEQGRDVGQHAARRVRLGRLRRRRVALPRGSRRSRVPHRRTRRASPRRSRSTAPASRRTARQFASGVARSRARSSRARAHPVEGSYTAKLFAGGVDRIGKKIGEEATEVVIAAKNADRGELVWETADLLYHALVLLAERGVSLDDVGAELSRRAKPTA